MDITYENKPAMTFIGFRTRILHEEGFVKCPEFWEREFTAKYARLWQSMQPETPVEKALLKYGVGAFAVCEDGEKDFEYWIAGLYTGGEVPEGLELCSFPSRRWAVFTATGPVPEALQALNRRVFNEWLPDEGKRLGADCRVTVEFYSLGDLRSSEYESGIWMPIGSCNE